MRVLYIKCVEGATHAEIAELLDREVNTIQYHMTKIYEILEIRQPGKSSKEMDSELKNEICPIIREMFNSIDEVRLWAPKIVQPSPATPVDVIEDNERGEPSETLPPYKPPPSVVKILQEGENQPAPPEIHAPPPPGIRRINWRVVIGGIILVGVIIIGLIYIPPLFSAPKSIPTEPTPTQTSQPPIAIAAPTEALPIAPTSTSTLTDKGSPTSTPSLPPSPTPKPTDIITKISPIDGMVLVKIPAGEFRMGSSRAKDPQTLEEEMPQHTVYLDEYWIDQTEITNEQYAMCVADEGACTVPANFGSLSRSSYYDNSLYADYPVIFVSWNQAAAYCAWAGGRLPTEAEWEKAARGPVSFIYPWGNTFDGKLANYCDINCINAWQDTSFDDGYTDTSPVGDYPAGASMYGILDLAGNVYEWVADWYGPYNLSDQINPTGPDQGQEHIIRGGSWGDDAIHIRAAVRSRVAVADFWMNFIGFRCSR